MMMLESLPDESAHWREATLPSAWPDRLSWRTPRHLGRLLGRLLGALLRGKTRRVELPEALKPQLQRFPRYLFQEFHHLPNGNYSQHIAHGYARSFDAVMLGKIRAARRALAERLADGRRALDAGTGAGAMAANLQQAGVAEVWGIEPSPYLLQLAARQHPALKLRHAVVEQSGFPDGFFDRITLCFVWHEIPPRQADRALAELHRLLQPSGLLAWIEPSPTQWEQGYRALWRQYGWRGVYFRALARRVFEPFVASWHRRDKKAWLAAHGFECLELHDQMPWQRVIARRLA